MSLLGIPNGADVKGFWVMNKSVFEPVSYVKFLTFVLIGGEFSKQMTLSLYSSIIHALLYMDSSYKAEFEDSMTPERLAEVKAFILRNKRHFLFKCNTKKPIYTFKVSETGEIEMRNDLPIILHHLYSQNGTLKGTRIQVYQEILDDIFSTMHCVKAPDGSAACVPGGINAMSKAFNEKYHYRGSFRCIREFLKTCKSCKVNNPLSNTQVAPPKPIRSYGPMQRIQYDLIDMAPKSRSHMTNNAWGYRYILSVKCCFSKFCWLFPLKSKKAYEVYSCIKLLFEKEGFPEILQSDNGKEFVNRLIKSFLEDYGVRMVRGRPRHPQSQGQVENLNKQAKRHFSRLLQNLTAEQQGRVWPLLLPGIADRLNGTWCSTIDDMPFRVFKNREPKIIRNVVVPEDEFWTEVLPSVDTMQEDCSGDSSYEDDDDDFTFFSPLNEVPSCTNSQTETVTNSEITPQEILQTCLGASLATSSFEEEGEDKIIAEEDDQEEADFDEEDELSVQTFNQTLFTLSKAWHLCTRLNVLNSTEYTIHRNVERCLKKSVETKFEIGDTVLIRNPERTFGSLSSDPFKPANVIAEIVEKVPGGMFKLKLEDDSVHFQKAVYTGEMVLFRKSTEKQMSSEEYVQEQASRKKLLDAISDYGIKVRRMFYTRRKVSCPSCVDQVQQKFENYADALDFGLLAELYEKNSPDKQRECHAKYLEMIESLKEENFPYFLYGSVYWERKRKAQLSEALLIYLFNDDQEYMRHQCVSCFRDESIYCDHPCCKEKAYNFLLRTGAKLPNAGGTKQDNKQGKQRKRKAGSLSESSTNRNCLKSGYGNNGSRKHVSPPSSCNLKPARGLTAGERHSSSSLDVTASCAVSLQDSKYPSGVPPSQIGRIATVTGGMREEDFTPGMEGRMSRNQLSTSSVVWVGMSRSSTKLETRITLPDFQASVCSRGISYRSSVTQTTDLSRSAKTSPVNWSSSLQIVSVASLKQPTSGPKPQYQYLIKLLPKSMVSSKTSEKVNTSARADQTCSKNTQPVKVATSTYQPSSEMLASCGRTLALNGCQRSSCGHDMRKTESSRSPPTDVQGYLIPSVGKPTTTPLTQVVKIPATEAKDITAQATKPPNTLASTTAFKLPPSKMVNVSATGSISLFDIARPNTNTCAMSVSTSVFKLPTSSSCSSTPKWNLPFDMQSVIKKLSVTRVKQQMSRPDTGLHRVLIHTTDSTMPVSDSHVVSSQATMSSKFFGVTESSSKSSTTAAAASTFNMPMRSSPTFSDSVSAPKRAVPGMQIFSACTRKRPAPTSPSQLVFNPAMRSKNPLDIVVSSTKAPITSVSISAFKLTKRPSSTPISSSGAPKQKLPLSIDSVVQKYGRAHSLGRFDYTLPASITLGRKLAKQCIKHLMYLEKTNPAWSSMIQILVDWLSVASWDKKIGRQQAIDNMRYLLEVVGNPCKDSVRKELYSGWARVSGIQVFMQCQGSTAFCGLCMLNNLVGCPNNQSTAFLVSDLNAAADLLWIRQAAEVQNLGEELEQLRSTDGDYSIHVLEFVVEQKGSRLVRADNLFKDFFGSIRVTDFGSETYKLLLGQMPCSRVGFCIDSKHYVTVLFLDSGMVLLDSRLKHPVSLNYVSCLSYIQTCISQDIFAAFYIPDRMTICGGHGSEECDDWSFQLELVGDSPKEIAISSLSSECDSSPNLLLKQDAIGTQKQYRNSTPLSHCVSEEVRVQSQTRKELAKMVTEDIEIIDIDALSSFPKEDTACLPEMSYKKLWSDMSWGPESLVSRDITDVRVVDIRSLRHGHHVNDVIINYARIILNAKFKHVYILDPLSVEKLLKEGSASKMKCNIPKSASIVMFPINERLKRHWWLISIDTELQIYGEYDPKNTNREDTYCRQVLISWLARNGIHRPTVCFLSVAQRDQLPSQGRNNTECGLFLISTMAALCSNLPLDFTLYDMDEVRTNLARIIDGSLDQNEISSGYLWKG